MKNDHDYVHGFGRRSAARALSQTLSVGTCTQLKRELLLQGQLSATLGH